MPERSSRSGNKTEKRGQGKKDLNLQVFEIAQIAIGEREKPDPTGGKNPAAVSLGRLGGLKGGKARAESLTPEKRREIAKKAAAKRWGKQQP